MAVKRNFKKRERHSVRKFWYILIMVLLSIVYFVGHNFLKLEWFTEFFATVGVIITAVAFWLEYHENKVLNEAQFAIDLNEQFIGNEKMSNVEWELEKFYTKYKNKELTEQDKEEFEKKFSIDCKERQALVNYLVHLEGIAALVKNKVLRIETIDDLMSYRYFIAMNNPVVQELELLEYLDFYKGCFDIYDTWVKELDDQGITPPMYDVVTNNLSKKKEERKLCQQKRN